MTGERRQREPRQHIGMSVYYDIVAGAIYLLLAAFLLASPPKGVNPDYIQIFMFVFGAYGIFRVGRGIFRLWKKKNESLRD